MLELKVSWRKNGRPREIKLSTEKVKEIAELKKFAMNGNYNNGRNLKQEMNHLGNSIKNAVLICMPSGIPLHKNGTWK